MNLKEEILDTPVNLHFKNGKVFPGNVQVIGYIFFVISVFVFFNIIYLASILLIVGLFVILTTYGTIIEEEERKIWEYTSYFGILKLGKRHDLSKFTYISAIPSRQSSTSYSRVNDSSVTEYFFGICILNAHYRNKQEFVKFEQRSKAEEIAKELAHRLKLEFFVYDPKEMRDRLLGLK